MKLLIVDDEPLIREYISCCVLDSGISCEIVDSVPSAAAALRVLERQMVDVVFADITMPKMDGLELLSVIRERWPKIQVVMLTCHDNFVFVRTAMKKEAADYVLKDEVSAQSMGELLRRISDQQRQAVMETRHEIDFASFMRGFMTDPSVERVDTQELSVYLGGQTLRHYAVLVFSYHKQLVDWLVEHRLEGIRQSWFFPYEERLVLMLLELAPQLGGNETVRLLQQLRAGLSSQPPCRLGISNVHRDGALLKTAIWEACADMNRSFYGADGLEGNDLREQDEESLKEMFLFRNNAISALANGNHAEFQNQLERIFHFAKNRAVHVGRLKRMMRFIAELSLSMRHAPDAELYQKIEEATHISELESVMFQLADYLQKPSFSEGIARAVSYLDAHFREELTLQQISSIACLSTEYFSRRFKKEVGMNYSEYVLQRRLAEAMKLLRTTDMLVGDVAAAAGMPNVSYFSSVFKKFYGISPNELRKK